MKTRTASAFWMVVKRLHYGGGSFWGQIKATVRNAYWIKTSPSPPSLLSPRRGEEGQSITVPTLAHQQRVHDHANASLACGYGLNDFSRT